MNTCLLDTIRWDVCLDAYGNFALASDPYSAAQDVVSALRTFLGEVWYNTSIGVPYFQQILGQQPSLPSLKSLIAQAVLTVPGCVNPVVYVSSYVNRKVVGQVQFTDTNFNNAVVTVSFGEGIFNLGISSLGGPDVI